LSACGAMDCFVASLLAMTKQLLRRRGGRTRHCERSEAIHLSACGAMDCFVASLLAMTKQLLRRRGEPAVLQVRLQPRPLGGGFPGILVLDVAVAADRLGQAG